MNETSNDNLKIIKIINNYEEFLSEEKKKNSSDDVEIGCKILCANNVVNENKLHKVQKDILGYLKDCLAKTYGPMGSYTAILKGENAQTIQAEYSKDGMKVLKNIIFSEPIEMAMQSQILEITRYVESKVGDGTTSAVILSSLIYDGLNSLIEYKKIPPRLVIQSFKELVELAKNIISNRGRNVTLEDIYNICMISTNGNEVVSNQIKNIYKEYGFDVNIDVVVSNDQNTKIKTYDGLTINEGYSDPAYINNIINGSAEIHDANIYAFQDPIDTPEMVSFMEKILIDNIYTPISNSENPIPTVIVAPKITRDASNVMSTLISTLYQYDSKKAQNQKPPVLIVSDISGTDEAVFLDIAKLCNCKYIHKYIDPKIQEADIKKGVAATLDNIHEFAGHADLVSSDLSKTKFINPQGIKDNNGVYEMIINFLKSEIKNAEDSNEDALTIGRLKKRLRMMESNMIDFMVGGISVSDRDALRDLVEDAVKNCASAVEYGVGRAANYEGLEAFLRIANEIDQNEENKSIKKYLVNIILYAYVEAATILYGSVLPREEARKMVYKSFNNGAPFDVMDLFNNHDNLENVTHGSNVVSSIRSDIEILDAISKIITIIVTSNQCLLQSTVINRY